MRQKWLVLYYLPYREDRKFKLIWKHLREPETSEACGEASSASSHHIQCVPGSCCFLNWIMGDALMGSTENAYALNFKHAHPRKQTKTVSACSVWIRNDNTPRKEVPPPHSNPINRTPTNQGVCCPVDRGAGPTASPGRSGWLTWASPLWPLAGRRQPWLTQADL